VLNKVVRLSLNISLLWIIQWQFFSKQARQFLSLIVALIVLGAIDILLLQTGSFIGLRTHEFLHPVVFSPLLAMVILSINILKPKETLAS
jgi:predicted membrane protein